MENIPDWAKNPEVYQRYNYPKEVSTGEPLPGEHAYKVFGENQLENLSGVSRIFQWASPSDK